MWKTLRSIKQFRLIGEELTREIIEEVFSDLRFDDREVINGDYSAATNNIFSYCSEAVAEVIIDELSWSEPQLGTKFRVNFWDDLKFLFIRALTKHEVFHSFSTIGKDGKRELDNFYGQQNHGQSMGSIVSFPILCIINAAGARWTAEINSGFRMRIRDTPMLINGDDIALLGYTGIYDQWAPVMELFGLKTSPGKTFFCRGLDSRPQGRGCFVMLNSMRFNLHSCVDWERDEYRWEKVLYLKLGVLFGKLRSCSVGVE
jgi:hypothetical protein